MKRNIALALAVLSMILVTLVSSNSSAGAQQGRRIVTFDTGVVTLGPNQMLRLTIMGRFNDGPTTIGFRGIKYAQGVCAAAYANWLT